ncbi:MAG: SDR family oxidoreductase [Lentisphaeria bacterium]|nr:SDR family oxidoreductase [Candidatus Neomarinimicrobiota bacterium]MCF7842210.1 SDR family oxidoreductase [Lentisphaeria bacterium]
MSQSKSNRPVIIVTGASRGIGRLLCEGLLEKNGVVYGLARHKAEMTIPDPPKRSEFIPYTMDIAQPKEIEKFYAHLDEKQDTPSVLINNAGVGYFKHAEDLTLEEWQAMVATNLTGTFLMTQGAIHRMKRQRMGTIVNMISVAGRQPFRNGSGYAVTKFGLDGFTKVIREELRKFRIRVIGVYPGATNSTWWDEIPGSENLPREKMLPPETVANAILNALAQPAEVVMEEIVIRSIYGNY